MGCGSMRKRIWERRSNPSKRMNTRAQHAYSQASDHSPTVEELITEHLDLVKRIVYQMPAEIRANAAHEDLVSAGTVGLVEAAHRFDEKQGVKFLTFAYRRIKGAVIDFLRKNDVLSKSARARLGRLNELRSRFRDKHGRSPSTAELSDLADLPEKTVLKFLGYGQLDRMGSLQTRVKDDQGNGTPLAALIPASTRTPFQKLAEKDRVKLLQAAIQELSERQQQIIVMYYYEELYMSEMAEVLGVSESRISQLHTRALYDLERKLEGLL